MKGQQDVDEGILADKLGVMAKKEEEYQELISEPKAELDEIIKEHEETALQGDHQCVELRFKIQENHKRFGTVIYFFEALDKKKEHTAAIEKAKEALATLNDSLATGKKKEVVVVEAAPGHQRGDSETKGTDVLDKGTEILEGAIEMYDSDEEDDDQGHVRMVSGVSSGGGEEHALDLDAALDDIEAEAETMAEMETEAIDEHYDEEGDTDGESDEDDDHGHSRTNTKTVTRIIVTGQDYNYEDEVEEDEEEEDEDKGDEDEFETAADEPQTGDAADGGNAAGEEGDAEAAKKAAEEGEGSEEGEESEEEEKSAEPETEHEKLFHQVKLLLSELFELEYAFHDDDVDEEAIQRIAARMMREAAGERTSVEKEAAAKVFEEGPPPVLEKPVDPAAAEEGGEAEGEVRISSMTDHKVLLTIFLQNT